MQQAVEGSYLLSAFSVPIIPSHVLGFSANDQAASAKKRIDRWAFMQALENLRTPGGS